MSWGYQQSLRSNLTGRPHVPFCRSSEMSRLFAKRYISVQFCRPAHSITGQWLPGGWVGTFFRWRRTNSAALCYPNLSCDHACCNWWCYFSMVLESQEWPFEAKLRRIDIVIITGPLGSTSEARYEWATPAVSLVTSRLPSMSLRRLLLYLSYVIKNMKYLLCT